MTMYPCGIAFEKRGVRLHLRDSNRVAGVEARDQSKFCEPRDRGDAALGWGGQRDLDRILQGYAGHRAAWSSRGGMYDTYGGC